MTSSAEVQPARRTAGSGVLAVDRLVVRWDVLVSAVVLVILFIPIKRYKFSVSLPFDLEPYRIVIALVVLLWLLSLLVDPRVTLRRTALDAPLLLSALAVIASVALNAGWITSNGFRGQDISGNVAKELIFLLSFYLVYYFIASVVRSPAAIDAVVKTLVLGGTVVAVSAIVERRTSYNVFDHLGSWIPLLRFEGVDALSRAGRLRVFGSAQHPIALAALLVMLVPLSVYVAQQARRRIWLVPVPILILAALATGSRTGVLMLATVAVVYVVLRPSTLKPVLVALLPTLIVVHLVVPGAIGSLRQSFFPKAGIVQDQTVYGGRLSSRRLGPQFAIIHEQPAFGRGYGTRITTGPQANALILDDQWLGTAVETGLVGAFAWLWLFVRFLRKAGAAARRDRSGRGWLLTGLAASTTAFAVGMLTFDAFSFIQATVVLFVLLAIGASTLAWHEGWPANREASGLRPV